jgi:hypothetical protein
LATKTFDFLTYCEAFFANLPLTIGAIALSTANLGVDWFKFAEENMDSCEPVHFHSAQCTFPEVSYFYRVNREHRVSISYFFSVSSRDVFIATDLLVCIKLPNDFIMLVQRLLGYSL